MITISDSIFIEETIDVSDPILYSHCKFVRCKWLHDGTITDDMTMGRSSFEYCKIIGHGVPVSITINQDPDKEVE